MLKNEKGITLSALVITIIVLLILASITLSGVLSDDGIIKNGLSAKEKAEISKEKEIIEISSVQVAHKNSYRGIEIKELEKALANNAGENKTSVVDSQDGMYIIKFLDNNRYYKLYEDGNVEYIKEVKEKKLKVYCVDSAGVNILNNEDYENGYIEYTIVTDKYSKNSPEVYDYEPIEEKIEGTIDSDKEITLTYYKILNDDTELVFTGLNSSGTITTVEDEIVSYMVGNGSTTSSNGLKFKGIKSVLRIPNTYNDKPVIQIGQYSFRSNSNIIKIIIPDSITTLGSNAFSSSKVEELEVGTNIQNIGVWPFNICTSLKTVTFNGNILSCFDSCTSWTEIRLGKNNKDYKLEDNVVYTLDGKTIKKCPTGRTGKFVIPKGVTIIDYKAFYNCNLLDEVIIPDTVITIGESAFHYCSKIQKLTIPDNVKTLGVNSFASCSGLKELTMGANIETIGTRAFYLLSSLKTVIYNGNIIRDFEDCANWTEVKLGDNNTDYKIEDNIVYTLDGKTLLVCPTARAGKVIIPEGVTTINYKAFYCCKLVEEVVMPDSLETIGTMAFLYCSKIQKIEFPDNFKTLSESAFRSCSKLSEITINDNMNKIGNIAFWYDDSLTTVKLNSSKIASLLTTKTSCGYLINYATTIYIKSDITTIGSYITSNFTLQESSDIEGYAKYLKNT